MSDIKRARVQIKTQDGEIIYASSNVKYIKNEDITLYAFYPLSALEKVFSKTIQEITVIFFDENEKRFIALSVQPLEIKENEVKGRVLKKSYERRSSLRIKIPPAKNIQLKIIIEKTKEEFIFQIDDISLKGVGLKKPKDKNINIQKGDIVKLIFEKEGKKIEGIGLVTNILEDKIGIDILNKERDLINELIKSAENVFLDSLSLS